MEDENNLIAKKLAHFGMQNAISKKHFGGYVGSIIIFRKGIKKVVLKKYKKTRILNDILFELDYLNFLNLSGFNVPKNITKPFKINSQYAIFFDYLPGQKKSQANIKTPELKLVIQTVAKIHKISKKFKSKYSKSDRDLFTFWFDKFVKNTYYKKIEHKKQSFLSNEFKVLNKIISSRKKEFKKVVIHNDLWVGNIKFKDNQIYFLDFDDCCFGAKVSDLAVIILDLISIKKRIDLKRFDLAIKLYKQENNLTKKEELILPALVRHRMLVQCNFYLMKYYETKKLMFKDKFNDNLKLLKSTSFGLEQ